MNDSRKRALPARFALMAVLLLALALLSFLLGQYQVTLWDVLKIFWSKVSPVEATWPKHAETALFSIRLPRLILAIFIGGGLSMAGSTYQAVFSNPIVSPDVLGATAGAGFGAALAILTKSGRWGLTLSSFSFGILAVGLVLAFAARARTNRTLSLVLTGMVISSLFSAGLSLLKLIADPLDQLPKITYWLMGSINGSTMKDVAFAVPLISVGMLVLFLLRWQLNVIVLGDEEAKSLGVPVTAMRTLMIAAATLITAAAVSVSGMIGWIGLVMPHIARLLVGADHRVQLPAAGFLGAMFLIVVDNVSRLAFSAETPIGILTAFIGAPVFLVLILRGERV